MMRKEIEFSSHAGNLSLVRQLVRDFLAGSGFDAREMDLMVLGIDEACANIIRHAYDREEDQPIKVKFEQTRAGIRFRLRDFGKHGDPLRMAGRPLDVVAPGGLGLHLIRRAFDQVDYILKRQGTELVLTKFERAPKARRPTKSPRQRKRRNQRTS